MSAYVLALVEYHSFYLHMSTASLLPSLSPRPSTETIELAFRIQQVNKHTPHKRHMKYECHTWANRSVHCLVCTLYTCCCDNFFLSYGNIILYFIFCIMLLFVSFIICSCPYDVRCEYVCDVCFGCVLIVFV